MSFLETYVLIKINLLSTVSNVKSKGGKFVSDTIFPNDIWR